MSTSSFGIIGLGVMGKSLALNVLDKGHTLSVFNRQVEGESHLVPDFMKAAPNAKGFTNLEGFVNSLETPRKILLMIKAGQAVDNVIHEVQPFLSRGDVLIDGGNSYYKDTKRRAELLNSEGIHFIGCGISGGEEGALKGPSMMPGGSEEGYAFIRSILDSIAAKDKNNNPCSTYIGPEGAGHFVKMIHNGIEYAEMQLLAELYHLLSITHTNDGIAAVFEKWNQGELSSYLLEITVVILRRKEGDQYLLDLILDKAANKGTGSWSSQAAMELGFPATMINDAVFARYISSFKSLRESLKANDPSQIKLESNVLKEAYIFGRWINHIQGFMLIEEASNQYQWKLNLSEIARVWTNGCIIRSQLMNQLISELKDGDLLHNNSILENLQHKSVAIKSVLATSLAGIPTPVLSSSYQFWLGMTTGRLPANLIQAQRDYFGAHTYQRVDKPSSEFFHTKWTDD